MPQAVPRTDAAPIVANLLGPVHLAVGARVLADDAWPRQSARGLLLLLLATPGHRLPRDRTLELLWPAAQPEAARNALYKALHVLRRVLEPDLAAGRASAYLLAGAEAVGFRPDAPLILDVDAFEERLVEGGEARARGEQAAQRPLLRDALALYRGDLLAAEPVLDWTVARREGLRRRWQRAGLDLAAMELGSGNPEAALPPLEALLAADASDEAALRLVMRVLGDLGRRDEALRRYEHGRVLLRDELGLEPDAATRELATSLRAASAGPPPATASPVARRWEEVPAPPSPLVGREREVERALDLLWRPDVRLVTLTGPGGVGKTRLALEVAAATMGDLAQGACFVDLSALRDADLVLPAIARALGLAEEADETPAVLQAALRSAELLLVLDNVEQVLEAAPAIAGLLATCRRLRLLATSREALRLRAEHDLPVPPLSLPPAGDKRGPARPADLVRYEAPALFLQRARALLPDAAISEEDAAAVVAICARLDGLPLAIELAAARGRELSPTALLARLDRRLPELTAGYRDLPARQRTLRDAIAWSHALLSPAEKVLFRRLGVFAGHFGPAAAAAVMECPAEATDGGAGGRWLGSAEGDDDATPARLLAALAAKSLIRWEPAIGAGQAQGRMLETIREYALERLAASGEAAAVQRAQVEYAISFAEEARRHLGGPEQGAWLDRLEGDYDNLRAALDWAINHVADRALHLAGGMTRFWKVRGFYREGLGWLESTLAASSHLRTPERAECLAAAGWMAESLGELDRSEALQAESLAIGRELGDGAIIGRALNNLGIVARIRGEALPAVALHEEALALARAAGDPVQIDSSLCGLATALVLAGDFDLAAERLAESLAICRDLGDPAGTAVTLLDTGSVALQRGNLIEAKAYYEESLALFREVGHASGIAFALSNLGEALVRDGDVDGGIAACREAGDRHRELGDLRSVAIALVNLADAEAMRGRVGEAAPLLAEALTLGQRARDRGLMAEMLEQTARFLSERGQAAAGLRAAGAAEVIRRETGAARQGANTLLHEQAMAAARASLPPDVAEQAWASGEEASPEDAIADAVAMLEVGDPQPSLHPA